MFDFADNFRKCGKFANGISKLNMFQKRKKSDASLQFALSIYIALSPRLLRPFFCNLPTFSGEKPASADVESVSLTNFNFLSL